MKKPDADGCYPMSMREHDAVRNLYGAINALLLKENAIKERVALIGMTEKYQQATDAYCEILAGILNSTPLRKREMIRKEMDNAYLYVSIGKSAAPPRGKDVYIDSNVLMNLINNCIKDHCFVCQKSYTEGTRHCPIYKAVTDCYSYEFDQTDDYCPLQGVWEIEEDPDLKP
jgi:hypothetical protein